MHSSLHTISGNMPSVTHELHNGYTTTAVAHQEEQASHNFSHKDNRHIINSMRYTTWGNMPPVMHEHNGYTTSAVAHHS